MFQPKQVIQIDLSKCKDFTDVKRIMKNYGIEKYTYTFGCKEGILKHGLSGDENSQIGERIYRQAGHLQGWKKRLSSSSGSDMRIISEDYQAKYGKPLDRNEMWIRVYDFTDAQFPDTEIELHEEHLIEESIKANEGRPPIGNKDYKTKRRAIKAKNITTLQKLFEGFEDDRLS